MPDSRVLVLILAFLLLSAVSPSPTPSPQETGKVNSEPTGEHTGGAIPSPATVQVAPQRATNPSNQYTYNYYYPSPSDIWTVVVAISTGLIAIFTVALWCTSRRQWKVASEGLNETKSANDLARRTLVITQRPKLNVRNVVIHNLRERNVPPDPILFRPNEYAFGQLYLSNVGGTKAKVEESLCVVWWSQGPLPHRRPYEGDPGNNPIAVGTVLEPGAPAITVLFSSKRPFGDEATHIWQGGQGWRLYVMGWVEYWDEIPKKCRMAFCRRYDPNERRFVQVENPDYEHGEE